MPMYPDPSPPGGAPTIGYGLDAAKPPAAGEPDGSGWISTDTNITYQVQGGVWVPVLSPSYTNPLPMTATLGGLLAGTTFLNRTIASILNDLLYPYLLPAFTALSLDTGSVLEVGTTIVGAHNFAFTWTNPTNVLPPPAPDGFYIRDMTGGVDLEVAQPLASPIAHIFAPLVYHVDGVNTFRIQGNNTLHAAFNTLFTVHWHWRYFAGPSALVGPLTEAQIEALATTSLSDTFARTYSFPAGATYKYICYPAVWGMATSFIDVATGFAVDMQAPYVVAVTNVNGDTTNYNVHRTTFVLGGAIDIAVS